MRTIIKTIIEDGSQQIGFTESCFEGPKRESDKRDTHTSHNFLHVYSRFRFLRFAGGHLQLLPMWIGGGKGRHSTLVRSPPPLGMLLMAIWILSHVCVKERVSIGDLSGGVDQHRR